MKFRSMLLSALLPALTVIPAMGQDDAFDLSSQRGEKQEYNPVNGHKIDHKGLIINPTPQSIERPLTGVLNASGGFKVNDRQKRFADDLGFLKQAPKGLPLTIEFGEKPAKKAGVKPVDGAYLLEIGAKDVKIIGYNERGAFYGLQTLRQILSSPVSHGGDELPMMVINDYPSMKYRGVVEGFYGTPWSHDVRMSLIDFYGKNKMNDYLYGPKDDPYHSSPNWRQPYPEDQARNIRELVEQSKRNRVNFIWAIHPGKDIRWNKEDYDSLVSKFNMMYDLGVRSFAIFFDDIEGEGTNPMRQAELLNNLTNDFVKAKGDVTNLIVCPTDYSQLWAKPGPDGPLAVYGRELNPNVEVFWTGAVVCSDLTPETLDFINSRIKRPALYWWNYPVTDYCKHILMQGPVYGLDTTLTSEQVAGIESNPMEHGEASKLALYGVADYAWNTPAYNPLDNWERGLADRVPGASDAYRTFAIHSADTENGYRRDESWETTVFPYNNYTPEQFEALRAEFAKITGVEAAMLANANPALIKEMAPWLTQFTALGERGLRTLDLIKTFESGDTVAFWNAFLANRMTPEQTEAYNAHKIGTMKLQPFYKNAMDDMIVAFYEKLTGEKPAILKGVGNVPYLSREMIAPMLDGDLSTFYT
ncbi:MAG: beta-N-acetylglucosaminidase domain-containing protein, partial [Paramuribaculum sp.]|nr:beta-N-acetylglucosaminidase domain-containing protein [Paramuribaculum sp.]